MILQQFGKLGYIDLAMAVTKNPKIVSETCLKWSQIGSTSESQGAPTTL